MKLTQIASRMYTLAREHQRPIMWELPRGLVLLVYHIPDPDGWLLTIMRDDVPPSAGEIQICRRDFRVPDHATAEISCRVVFITWSTRPLATASSAAQRHVQQELL